MKYISIFILLVFLANSCTEEISILSLENRTPVVEGYLFANQPIDSIRVTESISYSGDGSLRAIQNLDMTISNDENVFPLSHDGDGFYSNREILVEEDKVYKLSFEFGEKTVSACTYVNPAKDVAISKTSIDLSKIEFTGPGQGGLQGLPDQEIVEVTWNNKELNYYFVDVENVESNPEYVNGIFEFLDEQNVELPQRFFRSEPEIIDFYTLDTRRELQFFGTYEIIIYRLNTEYAALYESVGSSSISLREPPSNVKNGLGIFTAVTPHKLYLEVNKK